MKKLSRPMTSWKRAATSRARAVCFAGALAVYVLIIGIALAHHPLGWLASRSA
jgi:hypothetical protein